MVVTVKYQPQLLRPEYLSTDGVYRQSGNLSVVQRLRLQIDQGNLAVLDSVDDVHVLTGALKLFFRELQEPLIPWEVIFSTLHHLIYLLFEGFYHPPPQTTKSFLPRR